MGDIAKFGAPTYFVRAGFVTPTWTEVYSSYATWEQISQAYTWDDLAAGPVPNQDVVRIRTTRQVGSIFNRLSVGNADIVLLNKNSDYSIENTNSPHSPNIKPGKILSIKAYGGENLLRSSEEYDNGVYNNVRSSISVNAIIAPNDTLTADKLVEDGTSSSTHLINQNITYTSGVSFIYSVFAKAAERDQLRLTLGGGAFPTSPFANFDLTLVTVLTEGAGLDSSGIQDLGNDWFRCWVIATSDNTTLSNTQIFLLEDNLTTYDGDGSSGIYIWGSQVERSNLQVPGPYRKTVATATTDGGIFGIFSGLIDSYSVDPNLGRESVGINATDRAKFLRRNINVPMTVDTKVSSLVTDVLSTSGIPVAHRDVDTAMVDNIPFSLLDNTTGGDALDTALRSGAHFTFVNQHGKVTVKDRNFDLLQTATSSYDNKFLNLGYVNDIQSIINDSRIVSEPRKVKTDVATLAWLEEIPKISAGATITFLLEYVDPDTLEKNTPANSIGTPVLSADIVMNSQPDEGGSFTHSDAAFTIFVFARTSLVDVTNNSSLDTFLTKFQLSGFSLQRQPAFERRGEDLTSQADFERRTFEVENNLIIKQQFAQDYADFIVSKKKNPLPNIVFSLKNEFPDNLKNELLDRVTLIESNTAVGTDFRILGIEHEVAVSRGLEHVTRYSCELFDARSFLILDKDPEGKLDSGRTLGF